MKRLLVVGLVLVLAGVLWFVLHEPSTRGPGDSLSSPLAPESLEGQRAPLAVAPSAREELPVADAPEAAPREGEARAVAGESAPTVARTRLTVHGRVFDARGEVLGGVAIVGLDEGLGALVPLARTISDAAGRFTLALALEGARLESAADSSFVTLRAARVTLDSAAREQVLVVAPLLELGGTVAAVDGGPIAGATLRIATALEAFAGFPVPLDGTVAASIESHSGADGRFVFARAPAVAGADLFVRHRLFRGRELPLPEVSTPDLRIELEPLKSGDPWLQGVVVRADGSPAKDAEVRLGSLSTRSAADGGFALEKAWVDEESALVAVLEGFQPAVLPDSGRLMDGEYPPPFQRLVLGGAALTIRGQVLDAEGQPCRGWQVGLVDGTVVQLNQVPFDLAEDLARGEAVATRCGPDGRFELGGLLARDYVVQAYDAESLLMVRSPPTPAGVQDLVLRVPADAVQRLAGVVVAHDGTPLADVGVTPILVTLSSGGARLWEPGEALRTDARGRFEFARLPRQYVSLSVNGDGVMPQTFALDPAEGARELRLSVARRCHFRVELAGAASAATPAPDRISALDADGASLSLNTFQGNGWSAGPFAPLSKLGTHPLAVSEDARTLVFWRGKEELARVPLALVPGEVIVVQAPGSGR